MIELKTMYGKKIQLPKERVDFRPSVYGAIIQDGKLLVVKTKSTDQYFLPGGGVEIDETLEQALKREFKEEIGIDIDKGELINFKENFFYYEPTQEAMHAFLFFFLCTTKDEVQPDFTPPNDELEVASHHWIDLNNVDEKTFLDTAVDTIRILKGKF